MSAPENRQPGCLTLSEIVTILVVLAAAALVGSGYAWVTL